jgi:hypothetical protein
VSLVSCTCECECECPEPSSPLPKTRRVFSIKKNVANPMKIPSLLKYGPEAGHNHTQCLNSPAKEIH